MEKTMELVHKLYDELVRSQTAVSEKKKNLDILETELIAQSKAQAEKGKELNLREKAVKDLENIIAEQHKITEARSEIRQEWDKIKDARTALSDKEKTVAQLLDTAKQTEAETRAARERLFVEVRRVEELKANVKSQVMEDLVGRLSSKK